MRGCTITQGATFSQLQQVVATDLSLPVSTLTQAATRSVTRYVLTGVRGSLARRFRSWHSSVLFHIVLYQPQILLDDATLVWIDGESVDAYVGD